MNDQFVVLANLAPNWAGENPNAYFVGTKEECDAYVLNKIDQILVNNTEEAIRRVQAILRAILDEDWTWVEEQYMIKLPDGTILQYDDDAEMVTDLNRCISGELFVEQIEAKIPPFYMVLIDG